MGQSTKTVIFLGIVDVSFMKVLKVAFIISRFNFASHKYLSEKRFYWRMFTFYNFNCSTIIKYLFNCFCISYILKIFLRIYCELIHQKNIYNFNTNIIFEIVFHKNLCKTEIGEGQKCTFQYFFFSVFWAHFLLFF